MKTRLYSMQAIPILVVPLAAVLVHSPVKPAAQPPPRSQATKHETVDREYYLSMDDPVAAAKALLLEAARKGVDINRRIYPEKEFDEVYPPVGGPITATMSKDQILRELGRWATPHSQVLVMLQVRWHSSIADLAELMSHRVRYLHAVAGMGIIAVVPSDSLPGILAMPFVKWLSEYKPAPAQKIFAELPMRTDVPYIVRPYQYLGAKPEERSDLERLGAEVEEFSGGAYFVRPNPAIIDSIAGLWWVESISQPSMPHHEKFPGE